MTASAPWFTGAMSDGAVREPSGGAGAPSPSTAPTRPVVQRLMRRHSRGRLAGLCVTGAIAGIVTGLAWGWDFAPVVGWAAAAASFSAWVWLGLGRFDATETMRHATAEDPSRVMIDTLTLCANVGSLVAVGYVLWRAASAHGAYQGVLAGLAVVSVACSWLLVQTLFTLRYASLYYSDPVGGIDFNQDEAPAYLDFAYLSFTLGMTYQVSDTNLSGRAMRATVLRHSLLSYLFGSVILASTINLVVGLSTN